MRVNAVLPIVASMLDFLTPLTFAITGLSKDRQVYAPMGSGFFVAPYTGVTAAHVAYGLWDALEMPWNERKYPKSSVEPEFFAAAVQQIDWKQPEIAAHWEIKGVTPLGYTDIAFLTLAPRSHTAEKIRWPDPFPELELLPPPPKSRIWSFGYPGATFQHTPGESVVNVTTEPTIIEGEVIAHFESGRGSWSFPQFEVTCPFEPGMSGGPVVHDRRICGVISYGPELEGGQRGPSFAASLWPILASESGGTVDPRESKNPVLDMIETGAIRAPGWKQLQEQITGVETESGKWLPRLATTNPMRA